MNLFSLIKAACLLPVFALPLRGAAQEAMGPSTPPSHVLGRFNYTYLRLAYLMPVSGFNNPMQAGFTGSNNFTLIGDLHNSFGLGLESGRVRHFKKLNLGTDMLKLGINSGIALQGFGPGDKKDGNASAYTDGTYLIRLGLGPQVSFKPIEDLRIGVFYRAGIAVVYSSYVNEQSADLGGNVIRYDKTDLHFLHYAYNGDLGIDCSWRALCISLTYSMMKARPSKGALIDAGSLGDEYNAYSYSTKQGSGTESDKTFTPIDPVMKWHRIGVGIGFAF